MGFESVVYTELLSGLWIVDVSLYDVDSVQRGGRWAVKLSASLSLRLLRLLNFHANPAIKKEGGISFN